MLYVTDHVGNMSIFQNDVENFLNSIFKFYTVYTVQIFRNLRGQRNAGCQSKNTEIID